MPDDLAGYYDVFDENDNTNASSYGSANVNSADITMYAAYGETKLPGLIRKRVSAGSEGFGGGTSSARKQSAARVDRGKLVEIESGRRTHTIGFNSFVTIP